VRWQVNASDTGLIGRTDILTGIPANPLGRHSGCRIRFGPDGHLWAGTGDAAMGTNPQNPASLGGKVLRITTDGAGAPGNAGPPFRSEIYTYGHRNVQGLAFAADGTAYSIEHGPDRDDEVNRLVRGGNYGWDPVPGYNEAVPMTDLGKFPAAVPAVWSSGSPTIAPSGGAVLSGARWQGWDKALAMAVLKGHQLRVLGLTPDGRAVEAQWIVLTDRGRLRSAVQGPDGNLYIATDAAGGAGAILVVTPTA
jgi:glucose/arabinose dehydrogenase